MSNQDSLTSATDVLVFDSVAAAVAAFQAGGAAEGRIARWAIAMSDGMLKTKFAGSGGTFRDVVYRADRPEYGQITGFDATSATLSPSAALPLKVYF